MKQIWHDHSLTIVLVGLWAAMISLSAYGAVQSNQMGWEWVADLAANNQSEFMALTAIVLLSKRLFERDSAESKNPDE